MSTVDLQKFCSHDDLREYLRQPWTHKGRTYASNGHVLVCVSCPEHSETIANNPLADKVIDLLAKAGKTNYAPLTGFKKPEQCGACHGKGQTRQVKCDDCDGEGEFSHGRHEYKCKECEGDGWMAASAFDDDAELHDCPNCGGAGYHHSDAKFGVANFSSVYLLWLSELPGVQMATSEFPAAAHFTFDGGEGLLMPRRPE